MNNINIILCEVVNIRENRFVDLKPLFIPNGIPLPVLRNVPVAIFGDEKNYIDWKINVGNILPTFITTFDISSYISSGNKEKMDTTLRNSLNSTFALPLTIPSMKDVRNFPEAIKMIGDRFEVGKINQTGDVIRKGAENITGDINITGNLTVTAKATVAGIDFKSHKHKDAKNRYTTGAEK